MLNLHDLRFKDNEYLGLISSCISVIVLFGASTVLVFIFLRVRRLTPNLNEDQIIEFNLHYSVLVESLIETKRKCFIYFWKPLYLLRWAMTHSILIFFYDKPAFQIISLFILSVIWQCLILTLKPFERKSVNIISFYNELAVSLYLYVTLLLSDFLDTQVPDNDDDSTARPFLRLYLAWILTGILILTIFINFVFAFVTLAI
jgi:hypothetical protein